MGTTFRSMLATVAVLPLLAACATKGQLRTAVEQQRTALTTERNERFATDSALRPRGRALLSRVESHRRRVRGSGGLGPLQPPALRASCGSGEVVPGLARTSGNAGRRHRLWQEPSRRTERRPRTSWRRTESPC